MLAWRSLARRALQRWRRGAAGAAKRRAAEAAACKLADWRRMHAMVRAWRAAAARARAALRLAQRSLALALARAWQAWRAHHASSKRKTAANAAAEKHRALRLLIQAFARWRLVVARRRQAREHEDVEAWRAATRHHAVRVCGEAWRAWAAYVDARRPKARANTLFFALKCHEVSRVCEALLTVVISAGHAAAQAGALQRAARHHRRRSLGLALLGWRGLLDRRDAKRRALQRAAAK